MNLSEYEAKRSELDEKMQDLNHQESEKKMELSIAYQMKCKNIQRKIGDLKHQQKEALKNYQNDKIWWHHRFKSEKEKISQKMHLLRLEYLTVNNIECKETTKKNESREE